MSGLLELRDTDLDEAELLRIEQLIQQQKSHAKKKS